MPTTTSYALLGLLSVRTWTAYEMAKQTERSLGWFWPRAERKVYDEVKRLVSWKLASAAHGATGRRPRTVYAITPAGRDALAVWLGEPSAPVRLESEALVKTFFADGGDLGQLRVTLVGVRDDATDRLAALQAMIDTLADTAYGFTGRRGVNALGLRFQLGHHRHLVEWAEWALDATAHWNTTTDVGTWEWRDAVS